MCFITCLFTRLQPLSVLPPRCPPSPHPFRLGAANPFASPSFATTFQTRHSAPRTSRAMDTDANGTSRTALRQPFIETANALASLYKEAAKAERDAKDAGAASSYRTIMQWAATKSTSGESITAADVISFCTTELSKIRPSAPANPAERSSNPPPPNSDNSQRTQEPSAPSEAPTVAYIARDDALVSDIRKLNVNPRKRQRVDISDTFITACRNNESLIFATDNPYLLDSTEDSNATFRLQTESNDISTSRRDSARENSLFSSQHSDFHTSTRKSKNVKAQLYDKLRRK